MVQCVCVCMCVCLYVCLCVYCVCAHLCIYMCAMYIGKERLDVFEAKIEESEKAGSIYRRL